MPFNKKEKGFIEDNRLKLSSRKLAKHLGCSKYKVQRYLKANNLTPPDQIIEKFRCEALLGRTICTPAQDKILKRDYLKTPIKRLANQFGVSQIVIRKRLEQLNLIIPAELAMARKAANQIKPGTAPANKGKKMPVQIYKKCKATMFKKGNLPHNSKGVKDGDIRIRIYSNGVAYKYIRLSLGKWYPLHQNIWENKHGKVKRSYCLWFKDGNSLNCTLKNLELITRAELMKRNSWSIRLTDTFVAHTLCRKKGGFGLFDNELKELILQDKSLLDLKRNQLQLNRTINEHKKAK